MAEPRRIINVRAAQKARRFLRRIVALVRDAARGQVERGPRGIDDAALRRKATLTTGGTISAEHVARLPLINHLESHVEQLERSLA